MTYDKSYQIQKTLEFKDKELQRIAIKYINEMYAQYKKNTASVYSLTFRKIFQNMSLDERLVGKLQLNKYSPKELTKVLNQLNFIASNTEKEFKGKKFILNYKKNGIVISDCFKKIGESDDLDELPINPPSMSIWFKKNVFYDFCKSRFVDSRFFEAFKNWGKKTNKNIMMDYKMNQDCFNSMTINDLANKTEITKCLKRKHYLELLYHCYLLDYPETKDFNNFFSRSPYIVNFIRNKTSKNNAGGMKYDKFFKNNISEYYEIDNKCRVQYVDLSGLSKEIIYIIIDYFKSCAMMNYIRQTVDILKKYFIKFKINKLNDLNEYIFLEMVKENKLKYHSSRIIKFCIYICELMDEKTRNENFNSLKLNVLYKMAGSIPRNDFVIYYNNSNCETPYEDIVLLVDNNCSHSNSEIKNNTVLLDFSKIKNYKLRAMVKERLLLNSNVPFSRIDEYLYATRKLINLYFNEDSELSMISDDMILNYIDKEKNIKEKYNKIYLVKPCVEYINSVQGYYNKIKLFKPRAINRIFLPKNYKDSTILSIENIKKALENNEDDSLKNKLIKAFAELILLTSFRIGSLINLKIDHLDFENNKILKNDKVKINNGNWNKVSSEVMELLKRVILLTNEVRCKYPNSDLKNLIFVYERQCELHQLSRSVIQEYLKIHNTNTTQLRKISIRLQNDAANELGINPKLLMLARDHSPTSTVEYEVYDGFTDENIKTFGIVGDTTPNGDDVLDASDFRASVDVLTECESCENFCYRKEERKRIETKLRYYREVFETSEDETIKRYAGYAVEKLEKHLESVS